MNSILFQFIDLVAEVLAPPSLKRVFPDIDNGLIPDFQPFKSEALVYLQKFGRRLMKRVTPAVLTTEDHKSPDRRFNLIIGSYRIAELQCIPAGKPICQKTVSRGGKKERFIRPVFEEIERCPAPLLGQIFCHDTLMRMYPESIHDRPVEGGNGINDGSY